MSQPVELDRLCAEVKRLQVQEDRIPGLDALVAKLFGERDEAREGWTAAVDAYEADLRRAEERIAELEDALRGLSRPWRR